MTTRISRQQLEGKLARREPVVLVEALPRRHWEQGHLPGALSLPHDKVDALASRLLPDKEAEIVVYCASTPCRNSTLAAERLAALGYTRVRDYKEGKQDWVEAGLPLESGTAQLA